MLRLGQGQDAAMRGGLLGELPVGLEREPLDLLLAQAEAGDQLRCVAPEGRDQERLRPHHRLSGSRRLRVLVHALDLAQEAIAARLAAVALRPKGEVRVSHASWQMNENLQFERYPPSSSCPGSGRS